MSIKELYEKKGRLIEQLKEFSKAVADATDTTIAKEKSVEWDKYDEDYKTIVKQIDIALATEVIEAKNADYIETDVKKIPETGDELLKSSEYKKAFDDYLRRGDKMSDENKSVINRVVEYTTTDAEGGYTITEEMGDKIIVAKTLFGGMLDRTLTNWISTSNGGALIFPKVNDTAQSGYVVSEKGDLVDSNAMTFGTTEFGAYMYTSGLVKVSIQLLQDSKWDFASWLIEQLSIRFWRGLNTLFTTGSGSSTLEGIVTGANKGEDASKRGLTRDDFLNLYHSVDPVYRNSPFCRWMMNDSTLKILKAIVTSDTYNSAPLWQPSMREGAPDTIEGKPYIINQDMESVHPTYKPVLFGDFKQFLIREVLPLRIIRLDELYAATAEVGFVLLGRYDSGSLAADSSYPLRYIRNSTT